MQNKIKNLKDIEKILSQEKELGKKIVHCHGVFDLLHPGHIRHFKEAKKLGDCLVVTLTPDQFVNKGPGRPAFNQELRLESLASLSDVDYVVLNDEPSAINAINHVRPSVYVKGEEYKEHANDVTGKISDEADAVQRVGGCIHYTSDIVFSSSSLINKFIEAKDPELETFLSTVKEEYSDEKIMELVDKLNTLNVVIIGDAIIDEYQYVSPLGQSGKGLHMSATCLQKEAFLGGSFAIANHLSDFIKTITLITSVGKNCRHKNLINKKLSSNIEPIYIPSIHDDTLTKKRYVIRDGNQHTKLFETYSSNDAILDSDSKKFVLKKSLEKISSADLVLITDFGNGFIDEEIASSLCSDVKFLAVNTQTNSGNRGFNLITKYKKADFISINEPEARLATHLSCANIDEVIHKISKSIDCPHISITSGVKGVLCYTKKDLETQIPALAKNVLDRVGAGDSYLALAAICLAGGMPHKLAGFVGALAAAMNVQTVGNQYPTTKISLFKFLTRIMK